MAGYKVGEDIVFALDSASNEFRKDGKYHIDGKILISEELVEYYESLRAKYPIFSIEDAFAEDDFAGFKLITSKLGKKMQIVGDDLFCTNIKLLQQGVKEKMANALLVKPNQIGTITETLDAMNFAFRSGYNCISSHRSGESEDTTISHLAVGTNCGQIKTGSLARTDRTAKYNELIRIEKFLGSMSVYGGKSILSKFDDF
jgi:enolase